MNKTLFKTNSPEVDQSMEMFHSSTNKKPVLAGSVEQDKKQKQPASKNNNKPLLMKPVYKARKHEFF